MKKNLLLAIALLPYFVLGQASPVGSSNSQPPPNIGYSSQLITFQDEVYFQGDYLNGVELLRINDTDNLIYQFRDLHPGYYNSNPANFFVTAAGNEMYFTAHGNDFDHELWKTDGTWGGTLEVADFNGTTTGSFPEFISEATSTGKLVMKTNTWNSYIQVGTYDISSGNSGIIVVNPSWHSDPENFFSANGSVFFSAFHYITKKELYITDGTSAGTYIVKDINQQVNGNSNPADFVSFNNKVYFSADNGVNGRELWVTDGTAAGTQLVADINPGAGSSNPTNLTVFQNKLFFSATSATSGREVFYMFANENVLLHRDVNPGSGSSNPSNFLPYNGNLYFSADDGVNGEELWRTDGSIFGGVLFKDINPTAGSMPRFPIKYNGKLYFVADDGTTGREVWTTDGTSAGTTLVVDINTSGDSEPRSFTVAGDRLYFHANNGTARRIWNYADPTLSLENTSVVDYKLFPNPTQDYFQIELNATIEKIEIFSITGKKVKTFETASDIYDISDLSSGLYLVHVTSDKGPKVQKLIKD